jgi:hypothetical protein
MYSVNPYQPAPTDARPRRRSLVVIVSAGVGSIAALILLNLVVRPPSASPVIEVELAPAAVGEIDDATTTVPVTAVPISTTPASTASATVLPAATVPVTTAPVTTVPRTTVSSPLRWFPPDTPDFVRAQVRDDESVDVVAPFAGATMAYFAVTVRGSAACAGSVYRVEQGHERELVGSASYLYPRGDGRWVVLSSNQGVDCRPTTLTIIDTFNDTARQVPGAGWFSLWSPVAPRFVLSDYLLGKLTLYDGPSATSLRLSVALPFATELDQRTGAAADRPGWVMGRVAFLADGELVAHIQCQTQACAKKDTITGWFSVIDGQVSGEAARLPADKAPPAGNFCGL